MANDPKTSETTQETPESQEETFWNTLDEKIKTGVGAAIEDKLKEFRENANSRTGRSTLPGFIADFMFGKAPEKK